MEAAPTGEEVPPQATTIVSDAEVRRFNRHILDRSDPFDFAGTQQNDFSMAISFPVMRAGQEQILAELFNRIINQIHNGAIPSASIKLYDFDDIKTGSHEPPRRYVIIQKETRRKTRLSTYVTFSSYGDHIYASMDSFILGTLDIWSAILTPISFFAFFAAFPSTVQWITTPLAIGLAIWFTGGMIYELFQGRSITHVLRKRFHRVNRLGSFNVDDILTFFKSTNPMVLRTIQEVFTEHNLPTDMLAASILRINNAAPISKSGGIGNLISAVISSTLLRKR